MLCLPSHMVLFAINHDITSEANSPPGVTDSCHNPNNKPLKFKTQVQTAKNQKWNIPFNNKSDNDDDDILGGQTAFLQAIDKHSIVIAASEYAS